MATGWRLKPEHIGGFLSDGGVHQLALLTEVLGDVESVSGLTQQLKEQSGTDDVLFSTLKTAKGAIGTFTYGSAFGATDKSTFFKIFGTNGSATYDWSQVCQNHKLLMLQVPPQVKLLAKLLLK